MAIKFKTPRIKAEFLELPNRNKELYDMLDEISVWVSNNLNKDITITHLFRTAEEHNQLYRDTPELSRPKLSPHSLWKAADLRSRDFTDQELNGIVKFINNRFKNVNGKPAAFAHAIAGGAYHLHLQYRL